MKNVGLGEAAKRSIGNGTNQVPDMGFFKSQISTNGYAYSPSGYILQWGLLSGSNQYDFNFPIPFPTGGFILLGMAHTTDSAGVSSLSIVNGFIRGNSAGYLASANIVNGAPQFFARSIQWIALGK
ncbi:gp53-like domain-containing protein [Enterobacter hormaechei]